MRTPILALMVLALSLGGCAAKAPTADQPTNVAAVASKLRANPDQADKILAKNSLTRAQFDGLMYDVARDPGKTKAYRAALK